MTLIVGIVMPKGILMVSDTREMIEFTHEVHSDRVKKITHINRNLILGGSGSESNWYTAQILRNSLYNVTSSISGSATLKHILKMYRTVNQFHIQYHIKRDPVGEILISEYLPEGNKFKLHLNNGMNNFSSLKTQQEVKDVEAIGLNTPTTEEIKEIIRKELEKVSLDDFNRDNFYMNLAEYCRSFFSVLGINFISKSVYCVYLSSLNGQPASDTFFIDENGRHQKVDPLDSDKKIKF